MYIYNSMGNDTFQERSTLKKLPLGLDEVKALTTAVQAIIHPNTNIIHGLWLGAVEGNDIRALIIATAIENDKRPQEQNNNRHLFTQRWRYLHGDD